MDKEEILNRIAEIKRGLDQDQYEILKRKIMEKKFHTHRSNRNLFSKLIIEKFRKRLVLEIELILDPILTNQREINLRFLNEIDRLKKECLASEAGSGSRQNDE